MIFRINLLTMLISAMSMVYMADALVDVHPPFPRERSPIHHISRRNIYPGRLNQGYYPKTHMHRELHIREVARRRSREVVAREIANEIIHLFEQRNEERGGKLTMSHKEEKACRDQGGTPVLMDNMAEVECSMDPPPFRRTVWRTREGGIWKTVDGHGR